MEIIKLNSQNLKEQHICCAFSDKKCAVGYQKKKDWLQKEFTNGYSFRKLDARGKVFIEYAPIEHSWLPLKGSNFMVINCFWVSGKFKGNGYGKALFQDCLTDCKTRNKDGIVAISSDKKRPFISDPGFYKYLGFEIIDEAPPFFKLYGYKINQNADFPSIKSSAKTGKCQDNGGITAYYSNTCPFNDYYINEHLKKYAKEKGIPINIHPIKNKEDGRQMPVPWIINSVFYKGNFVTVEPKPYRHLNKLLP